MKFYVLSETVATAIIDEVMPIEKLPDDVFKMLSSEYNQEDFEGAFNDAILRPQDDYLRIL